MNKRKKVFPLVLGASASLLLAACGGSTGSASSEDYELTDVSFPLEETVTLKMTTSSSPLAPADPNEKLIFERLQEKTGVQIDWKNYSSDYVEKRNLDISSGDLPDAMWNAGASDYDLLSWADDGVIIPLEDLINDHMPNFKKVLDENPEYLAMITAPDGHIYSLPWIEELGQGKESIHTVNDMPWINVDWLEALDLEMPETTDELMAVLEAFKTQDPNGNGEADEIPISFIFDGGNEDMKFLYGAFGIGDNDDHLVVNDDGTVDFTADNEEYKEATKYFSELYAKGLIDPEAFEHDWNAYIAKGKEQRYGLYFTWDKTNASGANESYQPLPVLEGPTGIKHVTRTNGFGFSRDRFVITSANKNLELTAKWADQMYEPIQSVQNNWGTYGDEELQNIFELDEANNMLKHLPLDGTAPGELRQKTEAGGPLAILDEYFGTVTTMPDDAQWRLDILHENYVEYANNENNYPRVFLSLDDADRIAQIDADLFPFVNRKRAEWITNGMIDEEWDSYLEELERLGLSEWLTIKQNAYDQFQSNQ
ncbi:ABC transporter substrate-binding protein [Jeotgalibaca sp. A122]|uniref:ABC transporter substrate-binding protein n=1 Tax=Jeotgalibaca sp. A122 TaxID=3457322 RepID=UPI003FD4C750